MFSKAHRLEIQQTFSTWMCRNSPFSRNISTKSCRSAGQGQKILKKADKLPSLYNQTPIRNNGARKIYTGFITLKVSFNL